MLYLIVPLNINTQPQKKLVAKDQSKFHQGSMIASQLPITSS